MASGKFGVDEGRTDAAHQAGDAGRVAHREKEPVLLGDRDLVGHERQIAGLDGDEDEVGPAQRLGQAGDGLIAPGRRHTGLGLQPVAQRRVQLRGLDVDVVEAHDAGQVGAACQVTHEDVGPSPAAAADVGDCEFDGLI